MTTKITLNNIADSSLATLTGPKVTTIVYPGTETATDVVGGATINLTGSGFQSGCSVLVASTASSVVTFISSTQISFIAPALSAGTYVIYVINPDGGTAISIPGISYSGTPNWTTAAGSLGTAYETDAISSTLTATGDAPITYTLASGTLPTGSTLASNGTISGTAQATASATTYTFAVTARDAQNQTTNRSFSLTINPDIVTWVTPADSTVYTVAQNTAMSNITLSATSSAGGSITYAADTLPTGLSITGANIVGTPTVVASTTTTLTATSTATRTATKTINWSITVANDVYFEYNTLLIPGASTTFVDDASTNNFAVSIFGDTKPNSFNPYTPGYYSNYFDGSSNYLTVPSDSAFVFGTGNFTMEAWIYHIGNAPNGGVTTDRFLFGGFATSPACVFFLTNNALNLALWDSTTQRTSAGSVTPNTWTHIAFSRVGTSLYIAINGVVEMFSGFSTNFTVSRVNYIGRNDTTTDRYFPGYISNLRVIKGTGLYTSNFTPSTTPLTAITNTSLLTCQSNRFIDNSTNNFTITVAGNTSISSFDPFVPNSSYSTYGSGYFDGTGDYLEVVNNASNQMGAGDWTAEAWIYITSYSFIHVVFAKGGSTTDWFLAIKDSSGRLYFGVGTSDYFATTGPIVPLNTWNHVALVRSGTTINSYLNGVLGNTQTGISQTFASTGTLRIGRGRDTSTNYLSGYVSNARLVKGTAVYTTTFTPPSAPLTAITNTQLLTLQNNQSVNNNIFLDNSSNNFFVTRNGNTTQGTFSPYGGNWSNYFDGGTNRLTTATSSLFNLFGANITLECWVYMTATPAVLNRLITIGPNSAQSSLYLGIDTNRMVNFSVPFSSGANVTSGANLIPLNTWTHLAFVLSGSTGTLYINGTQVGQTTGWNITSTSSNYFYVGYDVTGTVDGKYTGYVSNVRLLVGTALYTSAFTPSTTPLTPITNTRMLTCQSNRMVDNSINNTTLTTVGSISIQRYSPFNPSSLTPTSYSWNLYSSGVFNIESAGSGFYKTNPALVSLSTGAFSVEGWHYATSSISSKNVRILSLGRDSAGSNTSWDLYISNGSALVWQRINTTATTYSANYTFNINTWYHVVACRDSSGNLALFVNGTRILLQANETTSYDYVAGSNDSIYMGATYNGSVWSYGLGYYSNVRLIKGATAYDPTQSTLTVPTTQLAVTAQTSFLLFGNNGSDLSGNFPLSIGANIIISRNDTVSTISTFNPFGYTSATTEGYSVSTIGGSGYFDGTGDYLTLADNPVFNLATNNFTIECWAYFNAITEQYFFGQIQSTVSNRSFVFSLNGTSKLYFEVRQSSTAFSITDSTNMVANSWVHIAAVRNGNTLTLYKNGVSVGTSSVTGLNVNDSTNLMGVGCGGGYVVNPMIGYLSNCRIVNGTAVYTSAFTPPTAPVTAITNTSLLLNFTNAGIIDNTMINNLETVGNAQISTAQTKFGGSSIYFDGTGDYLTLSPTTPATAFGTGDFTIEFWVNPSTKVGTFPGLFGNQTFTANSFVGYERHGSYPTKFSIFCYNYSNVNAMLISTTTVSTDTWYHIAITRNGNNFRLFVNGAVETTVTFAGSVDGNVPLRYIGCDYITNTFAGYIDDLRINKGYARYTSNFTPPVAAFNVR